MIGALVGINNIPSDMILKVLRFDCTNIPRDEDADSDDSEDFVSLGTKRPDFLSTKNHLL